MLSSFSPPSLHPELTGSANFLCHVKCTLKQTNINFDISGNWLLPRDDPKWSCHMFTERVYYAWGEEGGHWAARKYTLKLKRAQTAISLRRSFVGSGASHRHRKWMGSKFNIAMDGRKYFSTRYKNGFRRKWNTMLKANSPFRACRGQREKVLYVSLRELYIS